MARVSPYDLQASSLGMTASPAIQRDRLYCSYSAITISSAASATVLPAPGVNKTYALWGFTLDASGSLANNLEFKTPLGIVFYKGMTFDAGDVHTGGKNVILQLPLRVGANIGVILDITGGGSLSGVAGVYYTTIEID